MTEEQLRALEPALVRFLQPFLYCCNYTQTFGHLHTYIRGLLSNLPRKSVEPIALAAGTPVRSLQEFLRDHGWDHAAMIDLAQADLARRLPALPDDGNGTVGVIDETSFPKSGRMSPGVQRQWCGRLGKKDNCVVTVHLGVSRGRYTALIDGQLFLPQAWSDDRPRCRQAGIPDEMAHRPKWQIALGQVDRARGNGVALDWLTCDEGYGSKPAFLDGLHQRGQRFVAEVPKSMACHAVDAGQAPPKKGVSRPAECILVPALAGPALVVRVAHESTADDVWQCLEVPVWLREGEAWSAGAYRLVAAYNARTAEVKYLVSNAPAEVALAAVVRAALRRAGVERAFGIQKGELGLGHYEGRNYTGLMRHQGLCCLAGLFLADNAAEAQGGNGEVTVEQVSRAVAAVCWLLLQVSRGLDLIQATVATIAYHQRRNAAARTSHKKRFALPTFWIVARSRLYCSPPELLT
jgi:SRSO17 transposase